MSVDGFGGVIETDHASHTGWTLELTDDVHMDAEGITGCHAGYTTRLRNQDDPKKNVHTCGLTLDEALGQVASWLFRGKFMFTVKEDADREHVCWKDRP